MIRMFEHTVGDRKYAANTLPASKGLKLLKQLLGIFGPALAEIFGSAAPDDFKGEIKPEDFTVDSQAFSRAAQLFVENLDKVEVEALVKDMLHGMTVNGQPISSFDNEFSGNYGALMSLLSKVVTENYSSFFGESGFGGLLTLVNQARSNSSSPPAAS